MIVSDKNSYFVKSWWKFSTYLLHIPYKVGWNIPAPIWSNISKVINLIHNEKGDRYNIL